MADVRAFRALRYDPALIDPAAAIAPPYDVISPELQAALYERSEYNIVRVEYGKELAADTDSDNRYTRAARDLERWRDRGRLALDDRPAVYLYEQRFRWDGAWHRRRAWFCAVRLEPWNGVIKPHEHTLSAPKADRLRLLRATRTQVSPVFGMFRGPPPPVEVNGKPLVEFESDGQHHALWEIAHSAAIAGFASRLRDESVYIADGHHRYETALAYRDEVRARAPAWTGEEPQNFALMALTSEEDPGLLVLPTHRLVATPTFTIGPTERIEEDFHADDVSGALKDDQHFETVLRLLREGRDMCRILAVGLRPGQAHMLRLKDRRGVEASMPPAASSAWKRLDVNVLQYGILKAVFHIDETEMTRGELVAYEQNPRAARDAVASGAWRFAFILNPTPVEQVLAVADDGARMPQKSTYFYPKLPTGLLLRALE